MNPPRFTPRFRRLLPLIALVVLCFSSGCQQTNWTRVAAGMLAVDASASDFQSALLATGHPDDAKLADDIGAWRESGKPVFEAVQLIAAVPDSPNPSALVWNLVHVGDHIAANIPDSEKRRVAILGMLGFKMALRSAGLREPSGPSPDPAFAPPPSTPPIAMADTPPIQWRNVQ